MIQFTYMYAVIGIMHKINGIILRMVTFDSFS